MTLHGPSASEPTTAAVADRIDRELHERLRKLRDSGEIEVAAFYRVSEAVVAVTREYR